MDDGTMGEAGRWIDGMMHPNVLDCRGQPRGDLLQSWPAGLQDASLPKPRTFWARLPCSNRRLRKFKRKTPRGPPIVTMADSHPRQHPEW